MKAVDEEGLEDFRNRMTSRMAEIAEPFELEAAEVFNLMSNL